MGMKVYLLWFIPSEDREEDDGLLKEGVFSGNGQCWSSYVHGRSPKGASCIHLTLTNKPSPPVYLRSGLRDPRGRKSKTAIFQAQKKLATGD